MDFMKFELRSTFSSEKIARDTIAAFMAQADPTLEDVADVKTALSEAIENCRLSAYPNKIGPIFITAGLSNSNDYKELAIIVRDRGVGIEDIERARAPLYTTLSDDHSGVGFTIMESFMDSVNVRSTVGKGTTVTMKKVIHGKR